MDPLTSAWRKAVLPKSLGALSLLVCSLYGASTPADESDRLPPRESLAAERESSISTLSDSEAPQLGPSVDLRIRATVAPNPVKSGKPVTFILAVDSSGPNVVSNVKVSFTLPVRSSVVVQPAGEGWMCSVFEGLMTCFRPALRPGSAPDITIVVQPAPGETFARGTARVWSEDSPDPNPSNDTASAVATIEYDPLGFSSQVLAGGGFGCSQAGCLAPSPLAAAGTLFTAAAALFLVCRLARRDRARLPARRGG